MARPDLLRYTDLGPRGPDYRKGRRKARSARPPGRKKLRLPKFHTRTYNFDTHPPTGDRLTPLQYTLYIHTTFLSLLNKRLPRQTLIRHVLRQQRMKHYRPIGFRYNHILPKHASKFTPTPSLTAQLLSDQIHHQLSTQANPATFDAHLLPPDPSLWHQPPSSSTPNVPPLPSLPPNPPPIPPNSTAGTDSYCL